MPSMEIQLPRWMSNIGQSANVQVAEINLKTLPEINPTTLPEINPKTPPKFDLFTGINPKTLPEIKLFTNNVDTGRELYKGIEYQESNLPIVLFGVVVIAVIIYIG